MTREQKEALAEQKRLDLVTKIAKAGVKHGTSSARNGLSLVAGNKRAMAALGDVPGAQGLVRGADGFLNPNKARNQKKVEMSGQQETVEEQERQNPLPVVEEKKGMGGMGGFGGLMSGKVTSMWKDPQKGAFTACIDPRQLLRKWLTVNRSNSDTDDDCCRHSERRYGGRSNNGDDDEDRG